MTEKSLYSIGQFAKMCDVTIKQLRYLEDKGVLLPEIYNTENKYRYYSQNQMEVLIFIKTLRDLGVAFKDIDRILQNPSLDTSVCVLQGQMESINEEIQRLMVVYRQCTALMTQMLREQNRRTSIIDDSDINIYEVGIVEIPSRTVIFTRHDTKIDARDLFLDRLIELKKICHERGIVPFDSLHAIFHDGYMKQFGGTSGDLETYYPINTAVNQDESVKVMPGFKGLSGIHAGHYKNMKDSYIALETWAQKNGIALSDKSIEVYLLGPETTILPEQYLTRIVIPLIGSTI